MKDDRLTQMRVFVAVCESRGFTAAAHGLNVSQSFVSEHVSRLEKRLGVKLLHRSTRRQQITPEGRLFLDSTKRLLADLAQLEQQFFEEDPAGDISVSLPLAFGTDQIVPLIPKFTERYPKVRLRLSMSDEPVNALKCGFDIAVRLGNLEDSSMIARQICNLQRIVVAAPAYLDRNGSPMHPRDLRDHQCLMWDPKLSQLNRWPFMVDGELHEIGVDGMIQSNNGAALYHLCLAGAGIMRLAEYLAIPAIQDGRLVPLLSAYQDAKKTPVQALFFTGGDKSARVRAFINFLASEFQSPPWRSQLISSRDISYRQ